MLEPVLKPISLDGVRRLFLNNRVPAFLSPEKTICMPLNLDGGMIDTGLSCHDPEPTEEEVERLGKYFSRNSQYFATRLPTLKICGNEQIFRNEFQPSWISALVGHVDQTLENYLEKIRPADRGGRKNLMKRFERRWDDMKSLISASIYAGPNPKLKKSHSSEFLIYPQDLFLYGPPLDAREGPLLSLLKFLEAYLSVDTQLRTGIAGKVTVMVSQGSHQEGRELFDPIDGVRPHHEDDSDETYIELVRPQQIANENRDGCIDLRQLSTYYVPGVLRNYWETRELMNRTLLGFFLFAYHQISVDDVQTITDQARRHGNRAGHKKSFLRRLEQFLKQQKKETADQKCISYQAEAIAHAAAVLSNH